MPTAMTIFQWLLGIIAFAVLERQRAADEIQAEIAAHGKKYSDSFLAILFPITAPEELQMGEEMESSMYRSPAYPSTMEEIYSRETGR